MRRHFIIFYFEAGSNFCVRQGVSYSNSRIKMAALSSLFKTRPPKVVHSQIRKYCRLLYRTLAPRAQKTKTRHPRVNGRLTSAAISATRSSARCSRRQTAHRRVSSSCRRTAQRAQWVARKHGGNQALMYSRSRAFKH